MNAVAVLLNSLLALVILVIPDAYAEHPAARTSAPRELSSDSLRRLIIESTRARESQLCNVRLSARSRKYIARDGDGVRDRAVVRDLGVYACSILQDGGSYRIETDWYHPSSAATALLSSVSGFDAGTGESRCTAQSSQQKRAFGRIDVQPDLNILNNQVVYLLNPVIDQRLHLFQLWYLMRYADEVEVVDVGPNGVIEARMGQRTLGGDSILGERHMWFDPEKGFLLVRMHYRFDKESGYWEEWEYSVSETIESRGVWFPRVFREIARASFMEDGIASINDTTVSWFELGTVERGELTVPFVKGMRIVDAIQGVSYVSDENGRPVIGTVDRLVWSAESPSSDPQRGLYPVTLAIAGVVAVLLALSMRVAGSRVARCRPSV